MKAIERLKNGSTSLRDLRAFYNSIPENKWCKQMLTDGYGHYCARGHYQLLIDGDLLNNDNYKKFIKKHPNLMLVSANDNSISPKIGVLKHLDELIRNTHKSK